jgi:hypothetical protein
MSPIPALMARMTPRGISRERKVRNFRETGVAFCTERMAIAIIQMATRSEINRGAKDFIVVI